MHLCEYKHMYASNKPSSEEIIQLHAGMCSALADPRRILLIYALSEEPKNVGELTAILDVSQPSVSRHLKTLRERGLVNATREGTNVVYELTDQRLVEALDILLSVLSDQLVHRAGLVLEQQTESIRQS